ncbi:MULTISPECIES: hypothetical protein [unclassified Streptomyces]|uniref:hypothetical protein n=1 Tax=unclassified Streptomyces TaxID=2593676 RepID=UPI002E3800BC|nr:MULTISPECIES: hypothetical protein [unclassified Streptomyces]WUC62827.1 hypothetical protein OG861_00595 [Streptomyces sp. NBC_00539]
MPRRINGSDLFVASTLWASRSSRTGPAAPADPRLVAAALGMDPEGVMIYLADHVDVGRLPEA